MVKFRKKDKSKDKSKDKTKDKHVNIKIAPIEKSTDDVTEDDTSQTISTDTNFINTESRKPIDKLINDNHDDFEVDLATEETAPKAPAQTAVSGTNSPNSKNENGGQCSNSFPDVRKKHTIRNDLFEFGKKCIIPETDADSTDETMTNSKIRNAPFESSWSRISGTRFSVRQPQYARTYKKAPSAESLYECICCQAFLSDQRVDLMDSSTSSSIFPLPDEFSNGNLPKLEDNRLPQLLIVHYQIPSEQPNIFCKTQDGKGGTIAFYFTPSKSFCEKSNAIFNDEQAGVNPNISNNNNDDDGNITSGIKLFTEFCSKCEDGFDWRSKFKIIADVKDWEKYNPPSFISKLNGKPLLIRKSAEVSRGCVSTDGGEKIRYLEYRINMHKWIYIAKKCMVSLLPKLADMIIDLGFTIEARDDDELPECILGAIQVKHINPTNMATIPL